MTVHTKVLEALANAKSIQANFEVFAMQTQDDEAKQKYETAAKELQPVIDGLEARMKEIQMEEPQFRTDYSEEG